jgi:solute carrier family 13 (sodium-dependent dicarboxylate transporter), member 2/3/5
MSDVIAPMQTLSENADVSTVPARARLIGLVAGLAIFALVLALPVPAGLSIAAWRAAAVAALMATWWISEALPLPVTALIPIAFLPLMGVTTTAAATAPYANPVIFLFLGGFVLALAVEESGLHRRLAINVIGVFGTRPASLVGGFMLATAFVSMWVSNTATTLMMLPLATSVLAIADRSGDQDDGLSSALLLGIAYAASIGGMGTLIGTPPNALFAGFVSQTLGRPVGFFQWMMIGVPIVLVALPLTWLLLTKFLVKLRNEPLAGGAELVASERRSLGTMSRAEGFVAAVAVMAAVAWVTRPLYEQLVPEASDATIAVSAALVLLIVPYSWRPMSHAITWRRAETLPWGVLILFGGGLSIADAMQNTGLSKWMGDGLAGLSSLPSFAVLLILLSSVVLIGELASNVAMTAAFLPIAAAVAQPLGMDALQLAAAVTLAASAGFMLPVATPPNAIVYSTGRFTAARMARTGFLVDILLVLIIVVAVTLLAHRVF